MSGKARWSSYFNWLSCKLVLEQSVNYVRGDLLGQHKYFRGKQRTQQEQLQPSGSVCVCFVCAYVCVFMCAWLVERNHLPLPLKF